MSKKSAAHLDEVETVPKAIQRNCACGNSNVWSATMTTTLPSPPMGGEMSTDSNIASDVGQQATESNNHPERGGNYRKEEVGQKGGRQGRRLDDDNERRR
jgi:hypothetical protein